MEKKKRAKPAKKSVGLAPRTIDGLVKSPFCPIFVIPAKAGIQITQVVLDSCFRRSDGFSGFLREHHYCSYAIFTSKKQPLPCGCCNSIDCSHCGWNSAGCKV
jgi:hypothetical protein